MACCRVHLSELVSISPNSSLLHPLLELELPADVAEAADVVDTLEKEEEGLSIRTNGKDLFMLK